MNTYWMSPDWEERLKASRLATLLDLIICTQGQCLSMHSRGTTFRSTLADGQTVYLKRDHFTQKKNIFDDLLHGHLPTTKTTREWRIFQRLHDAGFIVPQVIACGYKTSLGLPTVGGLIMLPVDGTPLDAFLKQPHADDEKKQAVLAAEHTLADLQRHGIDWPDCKPEHFIIQTGGAIGLIDLERARFHHAPLPPDTCRRQLDHFRKRL